MDTAGVLRRPWKMTTKVLFFELLLLFLQLCSERNEFPTLKLGLGCQKNDIEVCYKFRQKFLLRFFMMTDQKKQLLTCSNIKLRNVHTQVCINHFSLWVNGLFRPPYWDIQQKLINSSPPPKLIDMRKVDIREHTR